MSNEPAKDAAKDAGRPRADRGLAETALPVAQPVVGNEHAAPPMAIPIPPRADATTPSAGRWKIDPTMAPVGADINRVVGEPAVPESPAPPGSLPANSEPASPVEDVKLPSRADRQMRGLGKSFAIGGGLLLVTIVVAFLFDWNRRTQEEARQREIAEAEAAKPKPPPPPALPPPPPPRTSRLITAIRQAKHDELKALLERKADPNQEVDGTTPLATAISWGDVPSVQLLLEAGADPDGKNVKGDTPLMFAARQGQSELAASLLAAGADITAADEQGATSLMHALDSGRPEVVKLLLEKGADPTARRKDGENALSIALGKNQLANYQLIDSATTKVKAPVTVDLNPIPWKYLSELPLTEPTKSAATPAVKPKVTGLESPHGLWLAPVDASTPARAVYKLDRKFRFIQGFAAVADTAYMKGNQRVIFRIVGDGKELWKSEELQRAGDFRNFRVAVADVVTLELVVDCKAGADGADTLWVEPKLVN